jgi:N-acyl amino acid synthase of PEP-CTERM/exosortase system
MMNVKFAPVTSRNAIVDTFKNCLTVVPANSQNLLDSVFRLRYQVYCIERGYFDPAGFPDGRERDCEDHRSVHYLLFDRAAAHPIGTVRMVLPHSGARLPVLRLVDTPHQHEVDLPLQTTAEVSRFAVSKAFRSGLEARSRASAGIRGARPQLSLPLLTLGLVQAVLMMGLGGSITHLVAIMEPSLLRLLGRLGIDFKPLGRSIEHHGLRQPGWAVMADVIRQVQRRHPGLWELAVEAGRPARSCASEQQNETKDGAHLAVSAWIASESTGSAVALA